jgi:hypothetical protein
MMISSMFSLCSAEIIDNGNSQLYDNNFHKVTYDDLYKSTENVKIGFPKNNFRGY